VNVARAGAAAAILAAVVLVGCVQQAVLPDDCGATTVLRPAALSGDHLTPQSIDVCKGQQVTLEITTERAGEIHLHGYDVEAPEVEVTPGDTATFAFKATRPGQFPIELHTPNNEPEIQIGVFTVHEP
jgi:FtsP/CotA-like multicopper oxidase with cupredoxin domain